jgi:hypothetical protein
MAEEPKGTQSLPPAEPLPEPDLDALLSSIPLFKDAFGPEGKSGDTKLSAPKEPASEATKAAPAEVPDEIQPPQELPPEEEEPPPEEEPKPELSDSVQKRIDKLTAQRKNAEEKAAALETELTDLKTKFAAPPPVAPSPASPLAGIESKAELQERVKLVLRAKSWAIQNLDGGNIDLGEGKTRWLDGPEVKGILANAEEMLSLHIPQRVQHIDAKGDFDSQALKAYPSLFKAGSADNKEMVSWLTVFPECRKYPDIALIIGDAIMGRKVRLAKSAQKGNGQTTPPLATPQPAAAPRVPKSRALSGEELSAIATDPSSKALDRFVDSLIAGGSEARAQRSKS